MTIRSQCHICMKSFSTSDGLQQHQAALHHFQCSECKKEFRAADDLAQHVRDTVHSKMYSCGKCQQKFAMTRDLEMHKRAKGHSEDYACGVCSKIFQKESDLAQHQAAKDHLPLSQSPFLFPTQDAEEPTTSESDSQEAVDPMTEFKENISKFRGKRGSTRAWLDFLSIELEKLQKALNLSNKKFKNLMWKRGLGLSDGVFYNGGLRFLLRENIIPRVSLTAVKARKETKFCLVTILRPN